MVMESGLSEFSPAPLGQASAAKDTTSKSFPLTQVGGAGFAAVKKHW